MMKIVLIGKLSMALAKSEIISTSSRASSTRVTQGVKTEKNATAALASIQASAQATRTVFLTVYACYLTEDGLLLMGKTPGDLPELVHLPNPSGDAQDTYDLRDTDGGFLLSEPQLTSQNDQSPRNFVLYLPVRMPEQQHQVLIGFQLTSGLEVEYFIQPVFYARLKLCKFQDAFEKFSPLLEQALSRALPAKHGLHQIVAAIRNAHQSPLKEAGAPAEQSKSESIRVPKERDVAENARQTNAYIQSPAIEANAGQGKFNGHFDLISDDLAQGWAWDGSDHQQRLTIELVCQGEVVGRARADLYRQDLFDAKMADGRYHFQIKLPLSLRDRQTHMLSARVANSQFELDGGPHSYQYQAGDLAVPDMIHPQTTAILARQVAQKFAHRIPDSELFLRRVRDANLLLETGDFREALREFVYLTEHFVDAALLRCKIGECHQFSFQTEEAIKAYQRALELDADFVPAYLGLGNSYGMAQAWQRALEIFRAGLLKHPDHAVLKERIAACLPKAKKAELEQLLQGEDQEKGIALLTDSLLEKPTDQHIAQHLAHLLYQRELLNSPANFTTQGVLQSSTLIRAYRANQLLFNLILDEAEQVLERKVQ